MENTNFYTLNDSELNDINGGVAEWVKLNVALGLGITLVGAVKLISQIGEKAALNRAGSGPCTCGSIH